MLNRLRQRRDRRKVVLTAFSNKATKVLNQMATFWGLEIDCMTCCQLLALRPVIDDESGKQVFKAIASRPARSIASA